MEAAEDVEERADVETKERIRSTERRTLEGV